MRPLAVLAVVVALAAVASAGGYGKHHGKIYMHLSSYKILQSGICSNIKVLIIGRSKLVRLQTLVSLNFFGKGKKNTECP